MVLSLPCPGEGRHDGVVHGGKRQKLPTLMPSAWQKIPSGWQSLRQRKCNSPQYPQMMMVFLYYQTDGPHKPGHCWWELCVMLVGLYLLTKTRWKHARLLNAEVQWPNNELPEVPPTAGPPPSVSATLIRKALSKMKCSKVASPSWIVAQMLKPAVEEGVELARQLTEAVIDQVMKLLHPRDGAHPWDAVWWRAW